MAPMRETRRRGKQVLAGMLVGVGFGFCVCLEIEARDLFAPKEQATTEADPTQSPSFDEQKKGIPQSLFTWIKMAKGYEVEWDTFGRKGWYTQDPRLKPVEPGSVFPQDIPAIYIVFESAPLEDPAQFSAQWFLEGEKGASHLCRSAKTPWRCRGMNAMDSWNSRSQETPGPSGRIW